MGRRVRFRDRGLCFGLGETGAAVPDRCVRQQDLDSYANAGFVDQDWGVVVGIADPGTAFVRVLWSDGTVSRLDLPDAVEGRVSISLSVPAGVTPQIVGRYSAEGERLGEVAVYPDGSPIPLDAPAPDAEPEGRRPPAPVAASPPTRHAYDVTSMAVAPRADHLPDTMRAAVYRRQGTLEVIDVPVPEAAPGEVLVEVEHCGVCGTDLHLVLDGWGRPDSINGHEYTGRVVAVGSDVEDWSIGDAVVGGLARACGTCFMCRAGREPLCEQRAPMGERDFQGAFAQYVATPSAQLVRPPDELDLRHAALAEPLAVALHALERTSVGSGARVLVAGAGPIGALIVVLLQGRGGVDVVVSEPSAHRRALAERLGASTCEPDALVAPVSPSAVVDAPFDLGFECSGKAAAMEACLGQLGRAGTLVIVGAGVDPPRFDPNRILLNELVVTGSCASGPADFTAALELLASGRIPAEDLVEREDVALEDMLDAMRRLQAGRLSGKVLVAPRGREEAR